MKLKARGWKSEIRREILSFFQLMNCILTFSFREKLKRDKALFNN